MEKTQGQVTYIDSDKGFGFLKVEGYEKSVFFHASELRRASFDEIRKDDLVSISNIEETDKGFRAKGVFLIS